MKIDVKKFSGTCLFLAGTILFLNGAVLLLAPQALFSDKERTEK